MPLIVDLSLHEKANQGREEFLNRLRAVEAIRTNRDRGEEGLTLYIHSIETFMLWRHLQAAIVKGNFDGLNGRYGCYNAAIEISEPLYLWLKKKLTRTRFCGKSSAGSRPYIVFVPRNNG